MLTGEKLVQFVVVSLMVKLPSLQPYPLADVAEMVQGLTQGASAMVIAFHLVQELSAYG